MLTFYRANKWAIPALVRKDDLLLLTRIQDCRIKNEKTALKQKRLVMDFHRSNILATMGCFVGLLLMVFIIYIGRADLVHQTKNTSVTAIVALSGLAVTIFCFFVRMFGMWLVRRKFQKLEGI